MQERREVARSGQAWIFLSLGALWLAGCNALVARTAEVPGRVPLVVKMTQDDAKRVDALTQAEPDGGNDERCDYWRKAPVSLPPGATGAREFCSHQARGWCAKADAEIVGDQQKKEERAQQTQQHEARQAHRRQQQQQQARRAKITNQELASGKCDSERHTKFQRVALELPRLMESASSGSGTFSLLHHAIIVATPSGEKFNVAQWLGGELHVYALGFESVQLEVEDPNGYAVNLRSSYEGMLKGYGRGTDSVVMQTNPGAKYEATVKGRGCVMLMVFKKL